MWSHGVERVTDKLPPSMREAVNGYVNAVAAALPEICRQNSVKIPKEKVSQFLLIIAIRKIWSIVNSQFWIVNDCVQIAERSNREMGDSAEGLFRGFRIGREEISADSEVQYQLAELRSDFLILLKEQDIEYLVREGISIGDVAKLMFGGRE